MKKYIAPQVHIESYIVNSEIASGYSSSGVNGNIGDNVIWDDGGGDNIIWDND